MNDNLGGKTVLAMLIMGIAFVLIVLLLSLRRPIETEKLVVSEASQPVFALLYIAEHNGYFQDAGLELEYKSFQSGRDALHSVIQGEAEIATVYETPVVLQSFRKQRLAVISTLHTSTRNTAFVARKDRGIWEPLNLRGKRIAVTTDTNGEFFAFLYLASLGIKPSEVTFVNTMPHDMAKVLADGEVDAVATWSNNVFDARDAVGKDRSLIFYSDVYTEMSVLTCRRETYEKRKDALRRLLQGIVRAQGFLEKNPEQAFRIVADRLPNATTRESWQAFTPQAVLSNVLLTILEQEAEWFIQSGKYDGHLPDFRHVIFPELLEEIKPGAVTVFVETWGETGSDMASEGGLGQARR